MVAIVSVVHAFYSINYVLFSMSCDVNTVYSMGNSRQFNPVVINAIWMAIVDALQLLATVLPRAYQMAISLAIEQEVQELGSSLWSLISHQEVPG